MPLSATELFWEIADDLQAEDPRVVEGTIMGGRCLRVGSEFLALAGFNVSGLVVKLPAKRVEELIADGKGEPFSPANRVFNEWVSVPIPDRKEWKSLLLEGIAFVCAPKPKASSKAAKSKPK
jgi:hypothetical protein